MTSKQRLSPFNGLGAVAFIVILGAVLMVIPATALLRALLCVVAIPPAFVLFRRVRKGSGTDRAPALAVLVVAPVFFVLALDIGVERAESTHVITIVRLITSVPQGDE